MDMMGAISLEQNRNWSVRDRLIKERQWFKKLKNVFPYDLNEKLN